MFSNNKNNLKISKEIIRIGKLKNDRQHNDLSKNANNNLQNNTQTTKDRETLIPLRNGDDAPEE
jgi:hemerythrin